MVGLVLPIFGRRHNDMLNKTSQGLITHGKCWAEPQKGGTRRVFLSTPATSWIRLIASFATLCSHAQRFVPSALPMQKQLPSAASTEVIQLQQELAAERALLAHRQEQHQQTLQAQTQEHREALRRLEQALAESQGAPKEVQGERQRAQDELPALQSQIQSLQDLKALAERECQELRATQRALVEDKAHLERALAEARAKSTADRRSVGELEALVARAMADGGRAGPVQALERLQRDRRELEAAQSDDDCQRRESEVPVSSGPGVSTSLIFAVGCALCC